MRIVLLAGIAMMLPVMVMGAAQRGWTVPESAAAMESPSEATPASVEAGKALFSQYCRSCHGETGAGDGGMVRVLQVELRNFQDPETLGPQSDGTIFFKLSNKGENKMPSFATRLTDEQRWDVINFLRSLSK